eukprot:858559-Prymnesium_polylepis.1
MKNLTLAGQRHLRGRQRELHGRRGHLSSCSVGAFPAIAGAERLPDRVPARQGRQVRRQAGHQPGCRLGVHHQPAGSDERRGGRLAHARALRSPPGRAGARGVHHAGHVQRNARRPRPLLVNAPCVRPFCAPTLVTAPVHCSHTYGPPSLDRLLPRQDAHRSAPAFAHAWVPAFAGPPLPAGASALAHTGAAFGGGAGNSATCVGGGSNVGDNMPHHYRFCQCPGGTCTATNQPTTCTSALALASLATPSTRTRCRALWPKSTCKGKDKETKNKADTPARPIAKYVCKELGRHPCLPSKSSQPPRRP